MLEFKLPDLGEGMQEAEIRRWLVGRGDTVRLDQPMVEVETDKAVVEIPSPAAGRIIDICVLEGSVAKLGEVLVLIESTGKKATRAEASKSGSAKEVAGTQQENANVTATETRPTTQQRVLAAPAVRKRAFELGIDLTEIKPSQASGRITMEDVAAHAERLKAVSTAPTTSEIRESVAQAVRGSDPDQSIDHAAPIAPDQLPLTYETGTKEETAAAEERKPLTGLRRRIAERMERSWRTIPHATAFDELDGSELVRLRQELKPIAEQRGVRLTYMPLLVKLLLPVLKEFPVFNASFDEERREVIYKKVYHLGIATDSPEGLLVPVLRDADKLTMLEIASRLEHLIAAAQKRTLAIHEVAGSTFTLNNVGSFGGSTGNPIINYPEVAILAVGRMQEKAVIQNGAIVARPMMPLALAFDHRLIDGALAGRFLARFKALVEHPQQLMLDML